MKFKEVLNTVKLITSIGEVPLILGESGIGKTALVKQISKENEYHLVTIDANLLKEGEIGGLPTVVKGETIYATHHKLVEIKRAIVNEGKKVLLFIDELNRCDHSVQQELMNLILNREINGYKLSEDVKIIAAMNPSNKYDNYRDSDYQVVEMDQAQEDRFVWVEMEADLKEWINWGMSQKGQIHEHIIEFLSTFPEYLHTPTSRESIKATPRSWERVSKAYTLYNKNKDVYSFSTLMNVVKGNVGVSISTDFGNFIKNISKPLPKPSEIFKEEFLPLEIKELIQRETHSKLYILCKNVLNYLEEKINDGEVKKELIVFSKLIQEYPRDLRLGIMKEIAQDSSEELYERLLDEDEFLQAFFSIYE
ncbi:MAG: ATP-binding protein [Clostridium sp.]